MKANYFALVVALFVVSISGFSQGLPAKSKNPIPIATQNAKINLNKADLSTLTGSFKGIGKKRAEAIIAYRDSHSGFKSIEELAEIKGFGQHFVDVNRDRLNEVFVVN